MKRSRFTTGLIATLLLCNMAYAQKYPHLAETPPMGWSSWNIFQVSIDENTIKEVADAMVTSGLCEAGYTYLNLDDGWQATQRDESGNLQADSEKFPSGIKSLIDYIHYKGLKFGIYSCAGPQTCAGYPGSRGYEYQDARQFANWGVDFLKYDWCHTKNIVAQEAYSTMSKALEAAKRPILFSMCEWGQNEPWKWGKEIAHMWRTTGDIWLSFNDTIQPFAFKTYSVLQIIDLQHGLRHYAGPGHWNDLDMLEVGNGLTENEDRAHFTMWCMLASPLILGNDVRQMSESTKKILLNTEVIDIDQDPLCIPGFRHMTDGELEFWFKPLSHDEWAFCILNRSTKEREYIIEWQDFNLYDTIAKKSLNFTDDTYTLRNLWTHKAEGDTQKNKKITIPGNDVILYRLSVK